jgi:hypothetical protein
MARFEFESETFWLFCLYPCFVWRTTFAFSCCAGDRCGKVGSDEDHGRSRRPGAEDRGWSHRLGTMWPDDREVR